MPIKIPDQLPAIKVLQQENIFVMSDSRASSQDIRPMEVAILNLMPNKIETEVQLMRLLANSPLQINIDLLRIDMRVPKNTPASHMDNFYHLFDDVKNSSKNYDGLIITGAPLGLVDYNEIYYWDKLQEVLDWAKKHVQSTLHLCWAAHAAFHHFYGIDRFVRPKKISGVFEHKTHDQYEPLTQGFDDTFKMPHSRYGQVPLEKLEAHPDLNVLASFEDGGAFLVASKDRRSVFIMGHPEYNATTLSDEYHRDIQNGLETEIPENYFPDDDVSKMPPNVWRSHGNLLFCNWLNHYVYQATPYDLSQLNQSK
ncbi:homoserine O-acetyltransferase MetA [Catenovulum maritimum]|uniref:Homoserine O-succinyltransferase n=1 Tax=Catenovulum maritimum TaxID=1513271 RepID=A0A0J8H1D8_9ALTE|nr:homoserine O-succinyltransferase [Catenovulum maritimum]KMT66838.1 homoserine O-succinyltransferase [Catenovulum maritimum]